MQFKQWFESNFRYSKDIPDKKLLADIDLIRQDKKFSNFDDYQIERMLFHHTVKEILKLGPEECLDRALDFQTHDSLSIGDIDFNFE